jgi:cell division septation protein DedD
MKTYAQSEELKHSDTEITLGTRSILGIFFALALVCGVFFGFGYSIGRGNTNKATAPDLTASSTRGAAQPAVKTVVEGSTSSALPESDADTDVPPPDHPAPVTHSKPSAAAAIIQQAPVAQRTASESVAPAYPTGVLQTSAGTPAPQKAVLPIYPAQAAAVVPSASIMVQIAAVSHREDADVLISALRKLGYNASARSDASDNLLRIQVGPFATRDQANATRTKLLNDGYNAILK